MYDQMMAFLEVVHAPFLHGDDLRWIINPSVSSQFVRR
jgi:hypothetical protein